MFCSPRYPRVRQNNNKSFFYPCSKRCGNVPITPSFSGRLRKIAVTFYGFPFWLRTYLLCMDIVRLKTRPPSIFVFAVYSILTWCIMSYTWHTHLHRPMDAITRIGKDAIHKFVFLKIRTLPFPFILFPSDNLEHKFLFAVCVAFVGMKISCWVRQQHVKVAKNILLKLIKF